MVVLSDTEQSCFMLMLKLQYQRLPLSQRRYAFVVIFNFPRSICSFLLISRKSNFKMIQSRCRRTLFRPQFFKHQLTFSANISIICTRQKFRMQKWNCLIRICACTPELLITENVIRCLKLVADSSLILLGISKIRSKFLIFCSFFNPPFLTPVGKRIFWMDPYNTLIGVVI